MQSEAHPQRQLLPPALEPEEVDLVKHPAKPSATSKAYDSWQAPAALSKTVTPNEKRRVTPPHEAERGLADKAESQPRA